MRKARGKTNVRSPCAAHSKCLSAQGVATITDLCYSLHRYCKKDVANHRLCTELYRAICSALQRNAMQCNAMQCEMA